MNWETWSSQIHHHSYHLTLPEHKNDNFQSNEKISINVYLLGRRPFVTIMYLNTMVKLQNTDLVTRKEPKDFFVALLSPSVIDYNISKFMSFCILAAEMQYEICWVPRIYMTNMSSLISFVLFYFINELLIIFVVMMNLSKFE